MLRRSHPYIGTLARACLPLSALVGLAGCGSLGLSPPTPTELALSCPKVAIVRDLQTVTQFRPGAGRDLTDVVSRAALVDYAGNCEYGSDGVTVNVNLFLVAERGPALQGEQAKYTYFVAMAKPGQDQPATKTTFDTTVDFPPGKNRAGNREELNPRIPLPKDVNAKDWNIFIGFQLTPEQLEYNRTQMEQPITR